MDRNRTWLTLAVVAIGVMGLGGCSPQAETPGPDLALPTPVVSPVQSNAGLFLPYPGPAAQIRFTHLDLEDGLSQSVVNCILQDNQGFIWIGTQDGLNRYDGYAFKVYRPDPGDPNSLSDRWINALFQDSRGMLWIGTRQGGLNRYDPQSGQFTHFMHSPLDPNSLVDDRVQAISEDQSGQLWVGTAVGLDRFSFARQSFEHFYLEELGGIESTRPNDPGPLEYPGDNITALFRDSRGSLWIGTAYAGLKRYDEPTGKITGFFTSPGNPYTLSSNSIRAIQEDPSGDLWIATDRGLNLFDTTSGLSRRYQHTPSDPDSLSSDNIRAIHVDQAGKLWVGTNAGLDRFQSPSRHFIHYRYDPSLASSLSADIVTFIFESRDSVIWVGTYGGGLNKYYRGQDRFGYYSSGTGNFSGLSGKVVFKIHADQDDTVWLATLDGGINRLDRETGRILSYQNDPQDPGSLMSDEAWSVYTDQAGTLWVGTAFGLDRLDAGETAFRHYRHDLAQKTSLAGAPVYDLLEDREGNLWIGTEFGLERYDPQSDGFIHYRPDSRRADSLSGYEVVTLFLDQDGRLWVGTFNDGLNRYQPQSDSFVRYQFDPQLPNSLSNDSVLAIYQDRSGSLWVGTFGGGLNRYDPASDSFVHYLESDGLPSNVVYGIQEDGQGLLWLSTNNGLSRFDPQAETFRNYKASDGLQGNEFNMNASARDEAGYLYFGGVNGLTVFDPIRILDSTYSPPVVLLGVAQDGRALNTGAAVEQLSEVTLHWPNNNFEFSYAGLSYAQPDRNQYAYRLENFDSTWNYVGSQRNGRYTNLPGGSYILWIAASNQDGVWNEDGWSMRVNVIPPFWQTRLFQVSAAAGVIGLAFTAYWMRLKSVQSYNRELERQVRDRTREIERLFEKTKELAVIEERNRLARELHDSAKQKAFAALAQLGTANGLFRKNPRGAKHHLVEAENLVYEVIEELTFLIQEMYPLALKEKGLAATVREYIFDWENRSDIQPDVTILNERPLPLEVEQAIYRVVQEALSNVARHSQAKRVEVVLSYGQEAIEVLISDDGCGFEPDTKPGGMGLRSIRERVESLAGTVRIESLPKCGTRLTARVPLPPGQGTGKGDKHD
jgi:ligand-binding sensor domain-containing protein/signal transduction histidine kinase